MLALDRRQNFTRWLILDKPNPLQHYLVRGILFWKRAPYALFSLEVVSPCGCLSLPRCNKVGTGCYFLHASWHVHTTPLNVDFLILLCPIEVKTKIGTAVACIVGSRVLWIHIVHLYASWCVWRRLTLVYFNRGRPVACPVVWSYYVSASKRLQRSQGQVIVGSESDSSVSYRLEQNRLLSNHARRVIS